MNDEVALPTGITLPTMYSVTVRVVPAVMLMSMTVPCDPSAPRVVKPRLAGPPAMGRRRGAGGGSYGYIFLVLTRFTQHSEIT